MMILIHSDETCGRYADLLDSLRKLYEKGFPDKDEREEFGEIVHRVKGQKDDTQPRSLILACPDPARPGHITGGLISDFYAVNGILHLIYIIIDESQRKKGIARQLILEGIPLLKEFIRSQGHRDIQNLYFESNIPEKTENDNFNPLIRLLIFSRLGAKHIPIPYVQPALDATRKPVHNLYLLTFPQFNSQTDRIKAEDVALFLSSLYKGLGISDPETGQEYIRMTEALKSQMNQEGDVLLSPIPNIENPSYRFEKSSVTWHLLPHRADAKAGELYAKAEAECRFTSSFEKDLLNYANQKSRPIKTWHLPPLHHITVEFPAEYEYVSEGQLHKIITSRHQIPVRVSVSFSFSALSKRTIWHLTMAPEKGEAFTEYDLIKLVTVFGSNQENCHLKNQIRFSDARDSSLFREPGEFLNNAYPELRDEKFTRLTTGIVQIDLNGSELQDESDISEFFRIFKSGQREEELPDEIREFSGMLCGIVLGIFDFKRMGESEIYDTIQPVMHNSFNYILLSRGNLLSVSLGDDLMDTVDESLIVSPYLLVPDTVLAFNEIVMSDARKMIESGLDPKVKRSIAMLEKMQETVNHHLNFRFFRNPFQYPTETAIYESGLKQRGILTSREYVESRMSDLANLIENKRSGRSIRSDAILNSLLVILTVIQMESIFENRWILWVGGAVVVLLVYWFTVRKSQG